METNVMDRVKTFADALNELGKDHPLVKAYNALIENNQKGLLSYQKLCIITAALNEGWEPTFAEDERRYYPFFWFYTQSDIDEISEHDSDGDKLDSIFLFDKPIGKYVGIAFGFWNFVPWGENTNFSSQICFKSKELAEYAGKQFIDIYAKFYLK